jgi:hypothetical protein
LLKKKVFMSGRTLQQEVMRVRAKSASWRATGEIIGISGALAWRVAHGKSDSAIARHFFNMPPKSIETTPCFVCGELHKLKTCPNKSDKGRHRRAAEFSSLKRVQIFDAMLAARGTTLTEWMNSELDEYINNSG